MNKTVTDAALRLILALGDSERAERLEDKARHEAALAELESLANPQRPRLRSVPNCGSLVQSCEHDVEFADIGFYAANIRAIREDKIDIAQRRPRLTLVHSD